MYARVYAAALNCLDLELNHSIPVREAEEGQALRHWPLGATRVHLWTAFGSILISRQLGQSDDPFG